MKKLLNEITNTFKEMETTAIIPYRDVVSAELKSLPDLEGSEKQIAWASKIRERCLVSTITDFCLAERSGTYGRKEIGKHTQEAIEFTRRLQISNIEQVATNLSAKWWIDNRFALENPTSIGYYGEVESNGLAIKLNLQHWAQQKEKELNRLDIAKETGEAQVVLKREEYIIKVTPKGEILLESKDQEYTFEISFQGGVITKMV
jgi:hypothetical protein